MKSFNEFKGYQTRTSYNADSKSFTNAPVQHAFLDTLPAAAQVEQSVVTLFDVELKHAA